MTLNHNELSKSLRLALAIGAVSAASFVPTEVSFAQAAQDDAVKLDTVSITGSRIRRAADVETAQPILNITKTDIQRSGLQNIGDVLTNLVVADNTTVTTVNNNTNANDGSINISLRGLGPDRTLVLVNGRRWVGDQDGIVDLNSIPLAIVERIEILKDGASAIYGSDAVSGVVNILTKQSFDGGEANAYIGETSEGDGRVESYDYTMGGSTDKISFVSNVAYSKQEAIFAGDRTLSDTPQEGVRPPFDGSSSFPAGGRFTVPSLPAVSNPCFGPTGRTLIPGTSGASAANFRPFNSCTDNYNFAPVNYLQQPFDRFSVFQQLNFQLTDNIRFSNTINYIKRRGDQRIAEVPLTLASSGASGPQWDFGDFSIAPNNFFNPFAAPVTTAGFRMIALGPRTNVFDYDTWAYTGVFDGSFNLGERNFTWDVGYQYQSFDKDASGANYVNLFNLRQALGPSYRDAGGTLRCGVTGTAPIVGCIPFNLFGGPDLGLAAGRINAAEQRQMLDYVGYTLVQQQQTKLTNYSGNVTGDIFDLPAGPLGIAVGAEYRRYDYFDQPDSLIAEGGSSTNFRVPTEGYLSSNEAYVELNVPVLADVFLAKSLEFGIATRYSDFSSEGKVGLNTVAPDLGNDTSSKFNFRWQPIDDLLVRGSWAQTFRSPSVDDLFNGGGEGFPNIGDPCASTAGRYAALNADQRARCTAQGVPVGGYAQPNAQIRQLTGGNPNLQPETGVTRTLGTVYSPTYLPNFNVSLDWYRIKLDDALTTFGGNTVLDRCIRQGQTGLCPFITRIAGGEIAVVRGVPFNAAELVSEGYDFGMNYMLDSDYGKFRWNFNSAYVSENYTRTADAQGNLSEIDNEVGELNTDTANWRVRGALATNWSMNDFDVTWTIRYLSKQDEFCGAAGLQPSELAPPAGQPFTSFADPNICDGGVDENGDLRNRIGAHTYHDLQGGWNAPWNARFVVGIRNVGDKDPSITTNTFSNSFGQGYDIPGSFYYASYQQKF